MTSRGPASTAATHRRKSESISRCRTETMPARIRQTHAQSQYVNRLVRAACCNRECGSHSRHAVNASRSLCTVSANNAPEPDPPDDGSCADGGDAQHPPADLDGQIPSAAVARCVARRCQRDVRMASPISLSPLRAAAGAHRRPTVGAAGTPPRRARRCAHASG